MKYIYILYSNISRFTHYSYIIIKRIRVSPFKIHVILFRYILHLIIIIIYKLYKNNCDFYIRPNVVVVVDKNVNVVYRISLNDWAFKSVKKNYEFLSKYNKELKIPDPINLTYIGLRIINNIVVVSSETKLNSRELNINTINNDIIIDIFSQLNQFYVKHLNISLLNFSAMIDKYDYLYKYYHQEWIDKLLILKKIINYKFNLFTNKNKKNIKSALTIIHGDLTYRNILRNKDIAFIDFDRSDLNYPEFDYFLFNVDLYTYKQYRTPTYDQFFDNLLMFTINENFMTNEINKFYELNDKFSENHKILFIIKYFLLYRTIAYSLLNFRFSEAEPIVILDKCLERVQSHDN